MPGPFATHALEYRRAGLSVIPTAGPNGKIPVFKKYMRYAKYLAAESSIEKFCQQFPDANLGLMCGPVSGVTAVDIDDPDLMGEAIMRFGETPVISMGHRGYHLFFRHQGERSTNRLDGVAIDVRGAQGNPLIIAPPSVRPDTGTKWTWERGCLPRDLDKLPSVKPGSLPLVADGHEKTNAEIPVPGSVPEGRRGDWLFREALRAARSCATLDALIDGMRTLNTECAPPLLDTEVISTAHSAWRHQVNGTNRAGQGGYALIDTRELQALGGNADAALMLMRLRAAHACRNDDFALTPALGAALDWTKPRFYRAREFLTCEGFIEQTHQGGRGLGNTARFRLKS
ncbi:MAG TPA: bifunctional DNA primase/polymerase [Alphaproteobacteria bacterium]|nr:bifunctional DNA primase/polymerase [Alphaproteobacteria bacterium]